MTKDELIALRRERGKQELNIGDKVVVHSASDKPLYDGKVATIIEKGIIGNEVYYGLYIEGEIVDRYSIPNPLNPKSQAIGKTALLAPFFAEDLELVRKPKHFVGEQPLTVERARKEMEGIASEIANNPEKAEQIQKEWEEAVSAKEQPTDEIKVGDIVRIKSNAPRKYCLGHAYAYKCLPLEVRRIESSEHVFADSVDGFMHFDIPARYLEPYYSVEDVRQMEEDLQREKEQHLREHSGKENDDPIKDISDAMEEYRKGFAKITSELVDFDWQQYRTELASKIAVAYAEKGRYKPSEIGEFAVMVANDVVDNLKKEV